MVLSCSIFSSCFIDDEGSVWTCGKIKFCGYGNEDVGESISKELTKIDLTNIISVSSHDYHTLCVDSNGNVFSFGRNEYGQLGHGDEEFLVDQEK